MGEKSGAEKESNVWVVNLLQIEREEWNTPTAGEDTEVNL